MTNGVAIGCARSIINTENLYSVPLGQLL